MASLSRYCAIIIMALATASLGGCSGEKILPAVGPGYEIVVLSPPDHRDLGANVSRILSRDVRLVQWEPTFQVIDDVLDDDSFYRTRKILFAVAPAGHDDLRRLMKRASGTEMQSSFPGLWIVLDPFAAGQVLLVLTGEKSAIEGVLSDRPDDLLAAVEDVAVTLLLTNLFRTGETPDARDRMLDLWGWGVRLPAEWVVDDRFAEDGFVRVWRDGPVAQIFVSWEDGRPERTPEAWVLRRDQLTGLYYQGDFVTRDPARLRAETGATFHGPPGAVLGGLWENEIYVIGGPFEAWAFYCPEDDRTYFVDISAYAPDRNKMPLMRILRAVVRTFRCGCAPGSRAGVAS